MIPPTSPSHFMFQNCTLVLNMHSLILHRLHYRIPWTLGKKFAVLHPLTSFLILCLSFHYLLPLIITSFHYLLPLFITSFPFSLPLTSFHYLFPLFITSILSCYTVPFSSFLSICICIGYYSSFLTVSFSFWENVKHFFISSILQNICSIEDHDQGHLYTNLEVPRLTCPGRGSNPPLAWEASTLEKSL